jgi:hypothetical protein
MGLILPKKNVENLRTYRESSLDIAVAHPAVQSIYWHLGISEHWVISFKGTWNS